MITGVFERQFTQGWLYPDTIPCKYSISELSINPADYGGLSKIAASYFEAGIEGDIGGEVYCIDGDDNVLATVVVDEAVTWNNFKRYRVPIELNAAESNYYLKFKASPSYDSWSLFTARLILEIQDSEKVVSELELCGGDDSSGGWMGTEEEDNLWAYSFWSYASAYGYQNDGTDEKWFRRVYIDKSHWQTVSKWQLEVVAACGDTVGNGATGYAALFNRSTGTMITGSEIQFTSDTPVRKTVDITNANMPDGVEVELRIYVYDRQAGEYFRVHRAKLLCFLQNTMHAESHHRAGTTVGGTSMIWLYDTRARLFYDPDKFPESTPVYFETTLTETGGNAHVFLHEVGDSDSGIPQKTLVPSTIESYTGKQPPEDYYGDWWNGISAAKLESYEGSGNLGESNIYLRTITPSSEHYVVCGNFNADNQIPVNAIISEVRIYTDLGIVGQESKFAGYSNYGPEHECTPFESEVSGDPPTIFFSTVVFTLTSDRSWVRADILDGAITLGVKAKQPANATDTLYIIDRINLVIGWHQDVSQLDGQAGVRSRQRSVDLSGGLTSQYRYVIHFYTESGNTVVHSPSYLIFDIEGEEAPQQPTLPAHWHGGYFGIDTPRTMKMFRFGRLVTDQTGFQVMNLLVDHIKSTFRNQEIIDYRPVNNSKVSVNRKSKLNQYMIKFPDEDCEANVLELSDSHIPLAER